MGSKNMENLQKTDPPLGLKALIDYFSKIYPDQQNPLQVTTLVKYWLGGQDPLDYISMYHNSGDASKGIPQHWHYISFGLSDLHGDERVHLRDKTEENDASGMGFELTFRLIKTQEELARETAEPQKPLLPPTWPANLLQSIARYCFQSGNTLCCGDNIPWRKSLDGSSKAILNNILIAQDAQLEGIRTPFGTVDFYQIVAVTDEELEQASRWNGHGVLDYLRRDAQTGGDWLITDMNRTRSVFELFPETLLGLQESLEQQGSDLTGVNADFTFREVPCCPIKLKQEVDEFSHSNAEQQAHRTHCESLQMNSIKRESHDCQFSSALNSNSLLNYSPMREQKTEHFIFLENIEITLAPYAAKFLLLAIKDRLRHGRHFTFKAQHLALTLVAESVSGSCVSKSQPYALMGYWLQVLIPNEIIPNMITAFQAANLNEIQNTQKRLEFEWPEQKLKLIIDLPYNKFPNQTNQLP